MIKQDREGTHGEAKTVLVYNLQQRKENAEALSTGPEAAEEFNPAHLTEEMISDLVHEKIQRD